MKHPHLQLLLLLTVCYLRAADPAPATPPTDGAYLGVIVVPLDNELFQKHMSVAEETGLVVLFVTPKSPAAKAGLKVHDVLLTMDKQTLKTPDQLGILVRKKKPGDAVAFDTVAAGARKTVAATLETRPVVLPNQSVTIATADVTDGTVIQGDLKTINGIYNDPTLSNDEKSKKINDRFTSKHFPNLRIVIAGRRVGVVPETDATKEDGGRDLASLPKPMRQLLEKRLKEAKDTPDTDTNVQVIRSGNSLILIHEVRHSQTQKKDDQK